MAKNFCPICGTALVPGLDACPNCGRMIEPDEPDRMAEPPPAYAQRPAYYTPGMQSYGQPELPEPISMGSYLGMSLLGMVPVIGLVFLLVWALDSPGRPNRRNFARGFLAARVIAWVVFFVLTFVLFLIMAVASPAFYY